MKKGKILGLLAMSAMLLTGCVDAMPELSDEQSEIIAEYAAGLMLKYSPNYDYKLAADEEVAAAMLLMAGLEESSEGAGTEISSEESEIQEDNTVQEPSQAEMSEEEQTQTSEIELVVNDADADIAELLAIDDIIIRYQSFGVYSSYPEENAGFSVDAAQGKKLLVVRFDMENATGEDVACDMFDAQLKMRMEVNGSSVRALTTMLSDDIISYMGTIPAGESREAVAVAEIEDISEEQIETLALQISNDSGSCALQLK